MSSDLLQKTLKTMGVMVGACVAFTAVVTLIALFAVGRAVGPRESLEPASGIVPASRIEGQRPPKADDAPPAPPAPSPLKSDSNKAELPPRASRAI
jgi:hypothetical protein